MLDKTKTDNRIQYLDVTKAVAIILVIIGHAIQYSNGMTYRTSEAFYSNLVFKMIYSFHMPLFMLVSGYFTWGSYQRHGGKKTLINRIKDLAPPILFWGTVLCLLDLLSHEYSTNRLIGNYTGTLWFFISIILCTTCIAICERSQHSLVWYLCIFVVIHLTPGLQLHKFMYVFFIAGFLKAKSASTHKSQIKEIAITFCCLCAWACCVFVYSNNMYIYKTGLTIVPPWAQLPLLEQLKVDIIRYLAGFAGSMFLIGLCKCVCNKTSIPQLILTIGKNTKEIYIIQMIAFVRVVSKITSDYQWNLIRTIIISLLMLAVCICLTSIIKNLSVYVMTKKNKKRTKIP